MIQRKQMVVFATLLGLLSLGLLAGCNRDSQVAPPTPQDRQQKDAEAQSKESGGGSAPKSPSDHGNIAGETGGAPNK